MARDETVRRSRIGLAKWWRCLAVGFGGAAAALFGEAVQEILELGALLGSEDLADLVVALLANLLELRIHLLVDSSSSGRQIALGAACVASRMDAITRVTKAGEDACSG